MTRNDIATTIREWCINRNIWLSDTHISVSENIQAHEDCLEHSESLRNAPCPMRFLMLFKAIWIGNMAPKDFNNEYLKRIHAPPIYFTRAATR